MEDDVHHFGVGLRHDGGVITDVQGSAWRTPWVVCPGAVAQLRSLQGAALADLREIPRAERAEQCLHLLDLALLAADHVHEAGLQCLYRIEVDHDVSPPAARMWRDGRELLQWGIDAGVIRGSRFDGIAMAELTRHGSSPVSSTRQLRHPECGPVAGDHFLPSRVHVFWP
jgi:Protein of unknown function (DUF2889)